MGKPYVITCMGEEFWINRDCGIEREKLYVLIRAFYDDGLIPAWFERPSKGAEALFERFTHFYYRFEGIRYFVMIVNSSVVIKARV